MNGASDLFLEACGAIGPLVLSWRDADTGEETRREFATPAVLVGRGPGADLVVDHPRVEVGHAYLQLIEGRLFAVDLGSREGLLWGGVPRVAGWVDRRRPVQIGSVTLGIVSGDHEGNDEPGPTPLTHRYPNRQPLPGVSLEGPGPEGKILRWSVNRVLTLVGRSPLCKLRLSSRDDPMFACALVRTPRGVWLVNLGAGGVVAVNGASCRETRIEDGDLIRIGTRAFRIFYDGTITPQHRQPVPSLERSGMRGLVTSASGAKNGSIAGLPHLELPVEAVFQPLLDRESAIPDVGSASFMQALSMLIGLFGELQRSHLDLVRDELEQIRKIGREMVTLKEKAERPNSTTRPLAPLPGDDDSPGPFETYDDMDLAPERPDPKAVHDVVGERLAAWEQERHSRWRKVLDLLVKP